MNRVILFNAPIPTKKADVFEMQKSFPRIGIASMAAYLLTNNVEVKVVDPEVQSWGEIEKLLKEFNPKVVGVPAFTSEIFAANETLGIVKGILPNVLGVVGGAHASALPRRTLEEFPDVDIVVMAEGEQTLTEITQGVSLGEIRGIGYRDHSQNIQINECRELIEDLDRLPYPAWQLYDLEKYKAGGVISGFGKNKQQLDLPVEGARGCPFDCKFCFRINGKSIRFKSPQRIVAEVERNIREFGADTIFFVEGTFGVNKVQTYEMCEELIRRRLNQKISWSTGGRVNVLDEFLLKKMKESGCVFLGYGVESGDQDLLNKMGKNITLQQIYDSFDICRKVGIKSEANFILGHIGETERSLGKTIRFARKLKADYANFAIMVPFPGTEIFAMAVKGENNFKIKSYDWRLYGKQIGAAMEFAHIPHETMIKLQTKAYLYFFLTPRRFLRLLGRLTPGRIKGAFRRIFALKIIFKS